MLNRLASESRHANTACFRHIRCPQVARHRWVSSFTSIMYSLSYHHPMDCPCQCWVDVVFVSARVCTKPNDLKLDAMHLFGLTQVEFHRLQRPLGFLLQDVGGLSRWLKELAVKLSRPSGRSGSHTGLIGFNPRRLKGPKRGMSSHATDLSVYAKSSSFHYCVTSMVMVHFNIRSGNVAAQAEMSLGADLVLRRFLEA